MTACFGLPSGLLLAADSAPQAIRVAFTAFPPWCFKDARGTYTGVLVDYFRDLARDVGLPLREEDVPIARLHHSISYGKLDLFVSRVPEGGFACCTSLGTAFLSETVIIGRKSGPLWDSRLPNQSICRTGLSGYTVPGFRMFDADSLATCMRMVARNRLPFLIGEHHSLVRTLLGLPADVRDALEPPQVIEKKDFHLFVSRSLEQSAFGPALRKAIQKRKTSDYIDRYLDSKP